MATKKTYYEKLKDPRWQKKRLEVMQEHDFKCEQCGDDTNTLNVHHKEYFKDLEPWEYTSSQLACLCEECHENFHSEHDVLKIACSVLTLSERVEIAALIAGFSGEKLATFIKICGNNYWPSLDLIYQEGVKAKKSYKKIMSERGYK